MSLLFRDYISTSMYYNNTHTNMYDTNTNIYDTDIFMLKSELTFPGFFKAFSPRSSYELIPRIHKKT